jgi:hypothetical protein
MSALGHKRTHALRSLPSFIKDANRIRDSGRDHHQQRRDQHAIDDQFHHGRAALLGVAIKWRMPHVGLVVTDSAAPAVGRWSLPATKTRMSTRRQGDKRWTAGQRHL